MSIVTILLFMLFGTNQPQSQGWRGIVPLHSTRADVERLLGQGECRDIQCFYRLDDVNVVLYYSSGDCKSGYVVWDVPPDTVVRISIYPKPRPLLSDLKIDESQFVKQQTGHIEGEIDYVNKAAGLIIEIYNGTVQGFYYGPSAEDQHLRCPEDQDMPISSFSSEIPEEQQQRLVETLKLFVEYSKTKQYEKQYELFLPEYAAGTFPVKNKQEFAQWVQTPGAFWEDWVDLRPSSAWSKQDKRFGKIYEVVLRAKTLESGKVIESDRLIHAVQKGGQWYLIGIFLEIRR